MGQGFLRGENRYSYVFCLTADLDIRVIWVVKRGKAAFGGAVGASAVAAAGVPTYRFSEACVVAAMWDSLETGGHGEGMPRTWR